MQYEQRKLHLSVTEMRTFVAVRPKESVNRSPRSPRSPRVAGESVSRIASRLSAYL
jgi:hypothetical protein